MHSYHPLAVQLFAFLVSLLLSSCYDDNEWSVTIYEPVCHQGTVRCNGNQEQICSQMGQWEPPRSCLDGSNCSVINGIEGCKFRQEDQNVPSLLDLDMMSFDQSIQVIPDQAIQVIPDQIGRAHV